MKRLFISLFFIFSVCIVGHSQDFVSCLILDKTGSMVGNGDGHGDNIWSDVQEYCCEMVDNLSTPVNLVIYTFDAKCSSPQCFSIKGDGDKEDVKNYIKSIVANGRSTAIYSALNTALDYLRSNYPKSNQLLYLVTDGRDNASSMTFRQSLEKFAANRGEYDHLYYIDLRGTARTDDVDAIKNTQGADIGVGTVKTASLKTAFSVVNYTIKESKYAEQRFVVSSLCDDDKESFKFDAVVGDLKGISVDITPSRNISVSSLEKIEEGKYSLKFNLDFLGNAPQECEIPVSLKGVDDAGHIVTFDPDNFVIKVSKRPRSVVKVINGGWK